MPSHSVTPGVQIRFTPISSAMHLIRTALMNTSGILSWGMSMAVAIFTGFWLRSTSKTLPKLSASRTALALSPPFFFTAQGER